MTDLLGQAEFLARRATELRERIGELRAQKDTSWDRLLRTAKLALGGIVGLGGIVAAPPTGGSSAFLFGAGLVLWADGFREDAELSNRSHRIALTIGELEHELDGVETALKLLRRAHNLHDPTHPPDI